MAAAGNNSRFAVTCGLLRQYMRREKQMGGLDAAFRPLPLVVVETAAAAEEEETDGRTMQLFPTRAGTGTSFQPYQQERWPPAEAQAKGPLTIVYDDRVVVVLEDFPADKAKELMQMAGSACSPAPNNGTAAAAQAQPPSSAVPIARKVSLKRFHQKRKERIGATEPYPKVTATSPAAEKDVVPDAGNTVTTTVKDKPAASWLGL